MSLTAFLSNPVVERAYKTAIEAGITAAATTPVASTSVELKIVFTVGATFVSVLWNSAGAAVAKSKNTKLTALAEAIDAAVNARLSTQAKAVETAPDLTEPGGSTPVTVS